MAQDQRLEDSDTKEGGEYVYDALVAAGIEVLVGLPGTQTLPLDRTVAQRDEMDYVMARHETAIPHIAWGYYEASGDPVATMTVPGPGDTNAMHGLKNAYNDCVPMVHISADVDPDQRGKVAIHEIEPDTFDTVVKANINVTNPRTLREAVERGLETALEPPYGPVRLGIPSGFLDAEIAAPPVTVSPERTTYDNATAYDEAIARLETADRPVVYLGGGTRRSAGAPRVVRELVAELDAPVFASYKGKGVFPEDDPHFVGVTASHLSAGGRRILDRADVVLALGTNFDGPTTDYWSLPMGDSLIHVNLDPGAIDTAYEADVAIIDDVAAAGEELLAGLRDRGGPDSTWAGGDVASRIRTEYFDHLDELGLLSDDAPGRTPAVYRALRDAIPREAIVATDVGGFRGWAKQVFEAYEIEGFITAGSWAGMGVGLPAAVGAKLARPNRPVVCFTGDGGLMMCLQELHTAIDHGLDVVTVVFNNRDYGSISKSPKIDRYTEGSRFQWRSPDFVEIAEGFGCRATAVESPSGAGDAVAAALDRADGPELIDVAIDTEEPSVKQVADYDSTVDLA